MSEEGSVSRVKKYWKLTIMNGTNIIQSLRIEHDSPQLSSGIWVKDSRPSHTKRTTLGVYDTSVCVLCHESGSQPSCGHASWPHSTIAHTCQDIQHAAVGLARSWNQTPESRLVCVCQLFDWPLAVTAETLTDAQTQATKVKERNAIQTHANC